MSISKLAWRNARGGAGRGIIVTIILVSMLISGVLNIGVCLQQTLVKSVVEQYGDAHVKFLNLTKAQADFLRNRIEMEYATYVIGLDVVGFAPDRTAFSMPLQSMEPLLGDKQVRVVDGAPPVRENEVAILPVAAELLGIPAKAGQAFTLLVGDNPGDAEPYEFVVSAVLEPNLLLEMLGATNIIVSEAFADAHYGGNDVYGRGANNRPNNTRQVTVRFRPGIDAAEKSGELARLAGITDPNDLKLNTMYLDATMQSGAVVMPVACIALLFMLMGALVIYNMFNMLLVKKIKQMGLLSVVGASRGQIAGCAYLEALIYALCALPVGLLLGAGLAWIAGSGAMKGIMPGVDMVIIFSPWAFLLAVLVTVVTVMLSVLLPVVRLSRVAPVEAVRFSGVAEKARRRRRYAQMGLNQLSRINLWRNRGRTLTTVISLTLSGVLFLAISNVASTQMGSVDGLVKMSFVGDMQIAKGMFSQEDWLDDAFVERVEAVPGVTDMITIHCAEFASEHAYDDPNIMNGRIIDEYIVGLDRERLLEQLAFAGLDASLLDALMEPGNVLANVFDGATTLAEWAKENGGAEQTLVYRTYDAADQPVDTQYKVNVVGVVPDGYMLASGGVYGGYIAATQMLEGFAPNVECEVIGVTVDPAKYDEVAASLSALCQGNKDLSFKAMKDAIEEQRTQMLGVYLLLYAIIAILGMVGFLNLMNTTFVGIEQRKRELGVLIALGAPERDIRRMLLGEGRLISIICLAISIPVGVALGFLGVHLLKGIGATYMNYTFPLWQIALLGALFLLVPALIGLRAAKNLGRHSAIELIQSNP